jgi:hypothetical protein
VQAGVVDAAVHILVISTDSMLQVNYGLFTAEIDPEFQQPPIVMQASATDSMLQVNYGLFTSEIDPEFQPSIVIQASVAY